MELITHSRQDCFKLCRKKHLFAYEKSIRRELDAKALRMGTAFHAGLEAIGNGKDRDWAIADAMALYEFCPDSFDTLEWDYEKETVARMLCGYHWRWSESPFEYIATEQSFKLPLMNPRAKRPSPSRTAKFAGKIDGIVRLADGRLAIIEHKLLGDDIGPDSFMWRMMRMSPQVTGYLSAARRLGYEVDAVLYDVARKPTIGPTKVPILDDLGAKVVINQATGNRVKTEKGLWRQTGDKEKGYVLQERPMTPEEWGDKLNNDIAERPDFYFQRVEIPRMDQDIEEFESELWDVAQTIRETQRSGRWYRTVNKNTCGFCAYFDLCAQKGFDPDGMLPPGFVRVSDPHPELSLDREILNVH